MSFYFVSLMAVHIALVWFNIYIYRVSLKVPYCFLSGLT